MLGSESTPFHCSILHLVTPLTTLWGVWKRGLREYKLEGNWLSLHIIENRGHEEQRLALNQA